MIYALDIVYVLYMFFAIKLRKAVLIYFTEALLAPVKSLHNDFLEIRSENNFWLQKTGQIIYMEKMLTDVFGYEITISDGVLIESDYWNHFPNSDFISGHIGSSASYVSHINDVTAVDFYVNVPAILYDSLTQMDMDKMAAMVHKYKFIDKNFKIRRV